MKYNRGLIKTILIIVIALVVLGYFGLDIKKIIQSPQVQKNLHDVWAFFKDIFITLWHLFYRAIVEIVSALKSLLPG